MNKPLKQSLSRDDLIKFAQNEIAFYGLDLKRISTILLAQLYQLWAKRTINIDNVTREIKALEGLDPRKRTRKEAPFSKNTSLFRLYYKHFTDPRFIVGNINAELGLNDGGNMNFSQIIGRLFHEHKGQYIENGFSDKLSYETTVGVLKRRSGRSEITGEWIIIAKDRGRRYYLCLASHTEKNDVILDRAKQACEMDFNNIIVSCTSPNKQ